jgi:hypothetical protein
MLYFSSMYSIITYSVILWGNSPHGIKIFKIQKKIIIIIITNLRNSDSRRNTLKTMEILPFYSQNIFSLLIYIVDSRHLSITNQDIQNINTRSNLKFHILSFNLTKFQ